MTAQPTLERGAVEPLPYGVHYDLADERYFGAGGLSQSGSKVLTESPRLYRWQLDNGIDPEDQRKFDDGHIVHSLILGGGIPVDVMPAEFTDWKKKIPQELRKLSEAAGRIAKLEHEMVRLRAVAKAARNDPWISALIDPEDGATEVSLSWEQHGVPWRARLDYLAHDGSRIGDLKTSRYASPRKFRKSCEDFGYFQQAAAYIDGCRILGLGDPQLMFGVVELKPPYLTSVVNLHPDDIERGRLANRRASLLWRRCMNDGEWPGYAPTTIEASGWWRTLQDSYEGGAPVADLDTPDQGDDDDEDQ